MPKMRAAIFVEPGRIALDEKLIPEIGPLDALVKITTTTICGTDIHILKGEYLVAKGLTIGHEPVGLIEKLGSAVTGYQEGQRVIAGAIAPSGHSYACLCGCGSQDGVGTRHGFRATGGWKFGNLIDGLPMQPSSAMTGSVSSHASSVSGRTRMRGPCWRSTIQSGAMTTAGTTRDGRVPVDIGAATSGTTV
jgi:Alcohol dehydrogenase GroES-like domain